VGGSRFSPDLQLQFAAFHTHQQLGLLRHFSTLQGMKSCHRAWPHMHGLAPAQYHNQINGFRVNIMWFWVLNIPNMLFSKTPTKAYTFEWLINLMVYWITVYHIIQFFGIRRKFHVGKCRFTKAKVKPKINRIKLHNAK
jgi:hypothetical protein